MALDLTQKIGVIVVALLLLVIGGMVVQYYAFPCEYLNPISKVSVDLIDSMVNSGSELQTSSLLLFATNDVISPIRIATCTKNILLPPVCVSLKEVEDNPSVQYVDSSNTGVINTGDSFDTKVSVVCDTGTQIKEDIADLGVPDWTDSPGCQSLTTHPGTACMVIIRNLN